MMTVEALAAAVQEPVERIEYWAQLGLVQRDGATYPPEAVQRARLIGLAVRRGISAEAIALACVRDDIIGRYADMIEGGTLGPTYSAADAARAAGLDASLADRVWVASGLSDQLEADDDDVGMLRGFALAVSAGMPPDALLQLMRVLNDTLTRVAEAETRLFHFYVHERLRADGLAGSALDAASERVSVPLQAMMEPAILYFHRKAWRRALREDLVMHLAQDLPADVDTIGRITIAILFVDLASFTPLTEVMGDTAAAAVVERFSHLVREAAGACDGRVLKQIGDEFMLVFPAGAQAVACGLSIMSKAAGEEQFPDVRLGAHAGSALYREGDYVGTTVNLAARVASQAVGGQFLVTGAIRQDIAAETGITFKAAGRRALKGVGEEVELFEVAWSRPDRPVDAVCGMVIAPHSSALTLDWHGTAMRFCSEACRDRFVENPSRYGA